MNYIIENDLLRVTIKSEGAELCSIIRKCDGQEMMWEADPAYWGKTSPILFPFIGKLYGGTYKYNGREYMGKKHGFARDYEFQIESRESDKIVFFITSNEDTEKEYPFKFVLKVEYTLDKAGLREQIYVVNKGENDILFSLGGHPAFACPLLVEGRRDGGRTDSSVKLYGLQDNSSVKVTEIDINTGMLTGREYMLPCQDGVFKIKDHIFDSDALVLAGQGVKKAGILDKNGNEYIRLSADTCPVWGIWSMPDGGASYICIEPWWGICDEDGYNGELADRPYMNRAKVGEPWSEGFTIEVIIP